MAQPWSCRLNTHLKVARLLCESDADQTSRATTRDHVVSLQAPEAACLLCGAVAREDKAVQTTVIRSSRRKHLQVTHLLCGAASTRARQCR